MGYKNVECWLMQGLDVSEAPENLQEAAWDYITKARHYVNLIHQM